MKKEFSCFSLASITVKILAIFLTLFTQFLFGQDSTGTITDIDGNVYETVKIGNQWWMAENLKVRKYRNGEVIPEVTHYSNWYKLSTDAFCVYHNHESYAGTYGYLYNWYAVNDRRNIAPAGWHVPTDEEWKQLEMYLGMSRSEADTFEWRGTNQGSKLAGIGLFWEDGALKKDSAFRASGFDALAGGLRTSNGYYSYLGYYAFFWSSTEYYSNYALYRVLFYNNSDVYRKSINKQHGFSVRCVRD